MIACETVEAHQYPSALTKQELLQRDKMTFKQIYTKGELLEPEKTDLALLEEETSVLTAMHNVTIEGRDPRSFRQPYRILLL